MSSDQTKPETKLKKTSHKIIIFVLSEVLSNIIRGLIRIGVSKCLLEPLFKCTVH